MEKAEESEVQAAREELEEGITAEDAACEVTLFVEQPEPLVTASESFTPRVGRMSNEEYFEYPDDFSISDEEYRAIFGKVSYVTATNKNIAVITENGDLYMWGKSDYGQVGGSAVDVNEPVKILSDVVTVELSESHAAAITQKGDLYLWGNNMNGQVGNGRNLEMQAMPVKVLTKVKKVSLGNYFSGALCENGELYGWGSSSGNGLGTETFKPAKIAEDVEDFAMNTRYGGYVTTDGVLYMWGINAHQQISDDGTWQYDTPVKLADNMASVAIGWECTYLVDKEGNFYYLGE